MKLVSLIKTLSVIDSIPKENSELLNDHINSFGPDSSRYLMKNMLGEQSGIQFLSKMKFFEDDVKRKVISPVNAVRFELLARRVNNIKVDVSKDIIQIKKSIVDKTGKYCNFLPKEAIDLIEEHGGGPKDDPFKVWSSDDRKLAIPFIINTDESKRSTEELYKLGCYIVRKLGIDDAHINTSNPLGSQNNSLNNYGWIAVSIKDTMKNTIHCGVRVYSDHFYSLLHIGKNLYDIIKKNKIIFPFNVDNDGSFLISKTDTLEDAINHLNSVKNVWLSLNHFVDQNNLMDIVNAKPQIVDLGQGSIIKYQQGLTIDSERLHQGSRCRKIIESKTLSVELKSLYLIKIHGVKFSRKNGQLYKIGISDNPNNRYKQIAMGFGLKEFVGIEQLFCLSNAGAYEMKIKEQLVNNTDIYYSGEYFISELNSNDLINLIKSYI